MASIDLISKKNKLHVQHTFFSNQQNNKICTCSTLFVLLCRCFAQLQRCFVGLKRQASQLNIIFMEELSYALTQYFVSCVHVRFYFSLPLIFTLLAASISHCLTAALNFRVFLRTKFVSFVFNHSLQLFLCYPRECKHKKKRRKRHTLHWYACGADGRSGGRAVGVRSHDYQIFSDRQITTLSNISLAMGLRAAPGAPP